MANKLRFGRQWLVTVKTQRGLVAELINLSDSTQESEPLRVTFEIWQPSNYGAFWYGDVSVYNLDEATQAKMFSLVGEGTEVIVNAGYIGGPYGEIFRGRVLQPMWERENVVDFKTTLRCLVGREVLSEGFISANRSAFASQDDLVRQMAKSAMTPTLQATGQPVTWSVNADSSLQNKNLERGKVMFGSPRKYLDQIARDNYMQWWYDSNDNVQIQDITKNLDPNVLVYTPQAGIVGTPEQMIVQTPALTRSGVNFRVLLDPRIRVTYPAKQVKLDMTSIVQLKREIGKFPTIFDSTGTYIVAGVRHIGDSRGNDWYTEVIAVTRDYGDIDLLTGEHSTPSTPVDINHG